MDLMGTDEQRGIDAAFLGGSPKAGLTGRLELLENHTMAALTGRLRLLEIHT